jgi:uncharacterized protein YyaL (SSP411 family)
LNKDNIKPNRLAASASPYLQQHAYNPVDWYPWGKEALNRAQKEDKPILVSIGYSACHWCHVMEHESFENETTASLMNDNYVCIKVDREERPDIDNIYMEAIQAMGLQGGWPLNVFLTPDQKPFYGGTYFPQAGWQQLLQSVASAFKENRAKLEESADKFMESISIDEVSKYKLSEYDQGFEKDLIDKATEEFYMKLDLTHGGVEKAPKFPMPSIWFHLLRQYFVTKDKKFLESVTLTLDKMSAGGIYDQLEGGFSRYSVDGKWFAPHFEKMLYDNGQLLGLYAEAYSLTRKKSYLKVIEQTIQWLKTNMLNSEGGFYSALDADSEGEEGKYYVWNADQLDNLLGDNAKAFKSFYGVKPAGNWENGYNILFQKDNLEVFLNEQQLTEGKWEEIHEECRQILLEVRNKKIKPGLDNKVLAGWNGIALSGIVKAYQVTGNKEYLDMALACAEFLQKNLMNSQGKITRVLGSDISGVLEDYAFVIEGFIDLYQSTFDPKWIRLAESLTVYTELNFLDKENGMFFYTDSNDQALIARKKEIFDNVIPSSNSAMAENLRRLGLIFENKDWTQISIKMVSQIKKIIGSDIEYMSNWASTYQSYLQPTAEIAILGDTFLTTGQDLASNFYPFKLLVGAKKSDETMPLLKGRNPIKGNTTIYVCFDKACKLPVQNVEEALNQLPGFEPAGT